MDEIDALVNRNEWYNMCRTAGMSHADAFAFAEKHRFDDVESAKRRAKNRAGKDSVTAGEVIAGVATVGVAVAAVAALEVDDALGNLPSTAAAVGLGVVGGILGLFL